MNDEDKTKMYVTKHKKYEIGKLKNKYIIVDKKNKHPILNSYIISKEEIENRKRAFLLIDLLENWEEIENTLKTMIEENIFLDLSGKNPTLCNAIKKIEEIFYYLLNDY